MHCPSANWWQHLVLPGAAQNVPVCFRKQHIGTVPRKGTLAHVSGVSEIFLPLLFHHVWAQTDQLKVNSIVCLILKSTE